MTVTIWHNPRCSKSRQTLALLEERGVSTDVRLYLKDAPTADELRAVVAALGLKSARDLMRRGEAEYKEQGLKDEHSEDVLIAAMVAIPRLIERPLVMSEKGAAIGRPPEAVLAIL